MAVVCCVEGCGRREHGGWVFGVWVGGGAEGVNMDLFEVVRGVTGGRCASEQQNGRRAILSEWMRARST